MQDTEDAGRKDEDKIFWGCAYTCVALKGACRFTGQAVHPQSSRAMPRLCHTQSYTFATPLPHLCHTYATPVPHLCHTRSCTYATPALVHVQHL